MSAIGKERELSMAEERGPLFRGLSFLSFGRSGASLLSAFFLSASERRLRMCALRSRKKGEARLNEKKSVFLFSFPGFVFF